MAMTPRELGNWIDRLGPALVLYARQWCDSPEDVVQESFLKLMSQRQTPSDVPAWLHRVVRNAGLDVSKANRRRQRREAQVAPRWFVEPDVDGLDADAAVAALELLPGEQREVIVARLWGGLTFDQIATNEGCSASSAYRRFEAGLESLRKILRESCPTH